MEGKHYLYLVTDNYSCEQTSNLESQSYELPNCEESEAVLLEVKMCNRLKGSVACDGITA